MVLLVERCNKAVLNLAAGNGGIASHRTLDYPGILLYGLYVLSPLPEELQNLIRIVAGDKLRAALDCLIDALRIFHAGSDPVADAAGTDHIEA